MDATVAIQTNEQDTPRARRMEWVEVRVVRELEVDVALFKLDTVRVVVSRIMCGDLRLVDGGRDDREPPKHAVEPVLKLIM